HATRPCPALHSFPTRRSSDLGGGSANIRTGDLAVKFNTTGRIEQTVSGLSPSTTYTSTGWGRTLSSSESGFIGVKSFGGSEITRSEEHTSELQSPYDLVCRLL